MILRFILPFSHKRPRVNDPHKVVLNYLRGWFALDLISIFPFEYLSSGINPQCAHFNHRLLHIYQPGLQLFKKGLTKHRGLSSIRLIKLLRLLRLLKLGRIFRAPQVLQRIEANMDIDYLQLKLCKYIIIFILYTHWLACLLFTMASYSELLSDNPAEQDTWIDDFTDRWGDLAGPVQEYVASLYFSAAIITRLGVGDIVPAATGEAPLVVSVVMQVVVPAACCGFYAYVIGGVFALLSAMHAENEAFVRELENLNQFMCYRNLPTALRVKLRDFLHFRWRERRHRGSDMNDLALTPNLSTAIFGYTHIPLLKSLHPFKDITDDFLTTLCEHLSMCMFSSQDMIIR